MKRIAVFPGSFDPFTIGHENIVKQGLAIFDHIIVAIGYNSLKKSYFHIDTRVKFIEELFKDEPRVSVKKYDNMTVDFVKEQGAHTILRGLRTAADFEYERAIAQINRKMSGIDSVFLLTRPEHTPVNSSIVRDILTHGGDASLLIPDIIYKMILKLKENNEK